MAFTITFKGGASTQAGDDEGYEFLPSGVLKVGKKSKQTFFAPGVWESVEADGHKEGGLIKGGGGLW